ncbi:MAG: methyltransferase family protein [Methanobacteriota archaeon]
MLDSTVIRALGIVMSLGALAGLLLFRRGQAPGGHPRDVRAADNPPRILQVLWPILVAIATFSPILAAVAPEVATSTVLNLTVPFDTAVQIVGFLLWGAGGLLVIWSGRTLGRFMVVDIAVSTDHELVRTGPYARIRHPTYAGAIAMAIGVALLLLSIPLIATAILTALIANYRAGKEERLLASPKGLGDPYRAYMARTGRFLPRIRG